MTNQTLCAKYEVTYKTPNFLTIAVAWVQKASSIFRQRQALKHMSYRQLEDIGISPQQAHYETSRSFWDLP